MEVSVDDLRASDIEVFMSVEATDDQVSVVRAAILASESIRSFAFVDQETALREYERLASEDPGLVPAAPTVPLPVSFRIELLHEGDDGKTTRVLEALPGVYEVSSRTTIQRKQRATTCRRPFDLEAFLAPSATIHDASDVMRHIRSEEGIASLRVIKRKEALRIFRCVFKAEPSVWRDTDEADLPLSIQITVRDAVDIPALAERIQSIPVVDGVTIRDPASEGAVPDPRTQ